MSIYDVFCCICYVILSVIGVFVLVALAFVGVCQLCMDYPLVLYFVTGLVEAGLVVMYFRGRNLMKRWVNDDS